METIRSPQDFLVYANSKSAASDKKKLGWYCQVFLEEFLLSLQFDQAIQAANSASESEVEARHPKTKGPKKLRKATIAEKGDFQILGEVFETVASILEDLARKDRSILPWLIEGLKTPNFLFSQPFAQSLVNLGLSRDEKAEMVAEVMHFYRLGWQTSITTPEEVCKSFSQDSEVLDLFEKEGCDGRSTLAWLQSNEDSRNQAQIKTQEEVASIEATFLHLPLEDKIRHLLALNLNSVKVVQLVLEKHWSTIIGHPGFEAVISKTLSVPPPRLDLGYLRLVRQVFDHLFQGAELRLKQYPDVAVILARIHFAKVVSDSEGPHIEFGYEFEDHNGQLVRDFKVLDYDGLHTAISTGWGSEDLKHYFRQGNLIRCHYLKSDPNKHAVYYP